MNNKNGYNNVNNKKNNICFHCQKEVVQMHKKYIVTMTQWQGHRVHGSLLFHIECFHEIAGSYYVEALDENKTKNHINIKT